MNSLKLNLDINELYILNEFINNIIEKEDFQADLIIEEVFVNIVNYSESEYINVNASFENNRLTVEFIDNGIPFNLLLAEDPKLPESIDDANIGGLGIYLTKQMADEIKYTFTDDENHLTIVKNIEP